MSGVPERVQPRSGAAAEIAALIADRGLRPGDPLPTEPTLSEQLGVGRTSVREAVKALQALGIVEIRRGQGTFVGAATTEALLPWLLFRTRQAAGGGSQLTELLDLREIIECELARRVAVRHDQQLVDALSACVARMTGPEEQIAAADREFHELLCAAPGIELGADLIRLFWDVYRERGRELADPIYTGRSVVDWHRLIVVAIETGDPEATAEAVRQHYGEIRKRLAAPRVSPEVHARRRPGPRLPGRARRVSGTAASGGSSPSPR